ncbi:GTPase [Streptomyces phaeochromogenes]|uniref:GTPase n=1 Tax=Streptomyces phaeochromogenes TaxID=1923 RepID=UPI002DDACC66|nr:GTPase [Streptomyces phaeochromogenes]WRZ28041.1 50S ribosome-binding GTPase [Streptomyces phaeochromogenes]
MRIILMGRTMAGKSTLLAALTGGSAERIGDGRPRFSRDVFAAPAVDLHDVEIVDTPGVGARDGADDVAQAMAEVPGADLVLWVASNDSFQEETAQELRAVALRGKPVVVALNCRQPLVDDLDREEFLEDPASVFAEHEGHFKMIRSHLSAAAVRPVAEVMLHAEAARQARADGDYGADLWEASRLSALLAVLEQESRKRRTARRVLREADEVRSQAQALSGALAAVERETREIVDVGRRMREDQERRAIRLVDGCMQRMEDDVVRLVGRRQGWPQNVTDFGPQVVEQWDTEQAALVAELDEALEARLSNLARAIEEAAVAVEREWTTAVRPHLKVTGMRDFRGLWKREAAGVAVGAGGALASMALGVYVGSLAGPAGTVVGAVAMGLGSLLVTPVRKKVQSLFTSRAEILEANRDLLRTEISKVLNELEAQVLAEVSGTIAGVLETLTTSHVRRAKAEAAALVVADLLACQQQVVDSAVSTLDHETVRCLLRVDGRPRLAASVGKVTRLPGVCILVEVPDEAVAEAWLFPPSSPEILAFGRRPSPDLPGAAAMSYVLGLTEEVPAFIRCRPDGIIVTTNAPAPIQVLEAWSATLSDHLGTPVKIVRPNAPRSVPA